ncbi:MAG: hypothetical protein K1X61_03835 [Chitinophagales bacterium]|nr:hypothetical protein [Chitinophagales bacterium]
MSKIKLVESGGIMGKSRSAQTEVNMTAAEIKAALEGAKAQVNPLARDACTYTVFIDNSAGIMVDPNKVKAKTGRILRRLMDDLVP